MCLQSKLMRTTGFVSLCQKALGNHAACRSEVLSGGRGMQREEQGLPATCLSLEAHCSMHPGVPLSPALIWEQVCIRPRCTLAKGASKPAIFLLPTSKLIAGVKSTDCSGLNPSCAVFLLCDLKQDSASVSSSAGESWYVLAHRAVTGTK